MQRASSARVRFGGFELNLPTGELWNGNTKVVLQEQPLQILRMLIERDGELLPREEIKKKFWPNDMVVEFDHSINAAIKNLRRALGASADEPKYIETLSRRGYRLMVPVEWVEQLSVASGQLSEPAYAAAARMPPEASVLIGERVAHYRVLEVIGGGGDRGIDCRRRQQVLMLALGTHYRFRHLENRPALVLLLGINNLHPCWVLLFG